MNSLNEQVIGTLANVIEKQQKEIDYLRGANKELYEALLNYLNTPRGKPPPFEKKSETNAPSGIPSDAVCYFMDGDTWFCVRPDFIDLQMSPAGYGKTQDAAYYSLLDEETAGLQ